MIKYDGKDYTSEFENMACRSVVQNIQVTYRIAKNATFTETHNGPPSKSRCRVLDKERHLIESQINNNTFNYRRRFPHGKNAKKLAFISGDIWTIDERFDYYIKKLMRVRAEAIELGIINADDSKKTKKRIKKEKVLQIKTITDYKLHVDNFILPTFTGMFLSELTFADLSAWAKEQEIVQDTLDNRCIPLRAIIDSTFRASQIHTNIFGSGNPIAEYESTYEVNAFTPDEHKRILSVEMPDYIRNMLETWLFTGLRTGEIFGLKWTNFNKAENRLLIDSQFRNGKEIKRTKTKAGTREFTLIKTAREAIITQEKITKMNIEEIENPNKLIFMDMKNGQPWNYQTFGLVWEKLLIKANVPHRRPYNIRHTFATMILNIEGQSALGQLSRVLGHKNTATTEQIYIDKNVKWKDEDWSKVETHFSEKG
jgi:integrase